MVHFVQLKQEVIDELQKGFNRHPQLDSVAIHCYGITNMYSRDILYTRVFVVKYDDRNDAFKIIEPRHVKNQYLSKNHVEDYYNPFQLNDDVFEWSE